MGIAKLLLRRAYSDHSDPEVRGGASESDELAVEHIDHLLVPERLEGSRIEGHCSFMELWRRVYAEMVDRHCWLYGEGLDAGRSLDGGYVRSSYFLMVVRY